jgi:hypothetical protein
MFAGSDSGGERAAAIYSLVGTARLNGLDPETYLQHVFERIADHPINRIGEGIAWSVELKAESVESVLADLYDHRPDTADTDDGAILRLKRSDLDESAAPLQGTTGNEA